MYSIAEDIIDQWRSPSWGGEWFHEDWDWLTNPLNKRFLEGDTMDSKVWREMVILAQRELGETSE